MPRALCYGYVDEETAISNLREHRKAHEERLEKLMIIKLAMEGSPPHPFRTGTLLSVERGVMYCEEYMRWCDWAIEYIENEARGDDGAGG